MMFVLYRYLCRVYFGGVSESCDCGSMKDDRQWFILCSGCFVVLLCDVHGFRWCCYGGGARCVSIGCGSRQWCMQFYLIVS